MSKFKIIFVLFLVAFIFSKISEGCESSKRQDRLDQLLVHATELNAKYKGKYVGSLVTGISVPSAGIFPEKVGLSIDIGEFQPNLVEDVADGFFGKSDIQQTKLDHLSAPVRGIWVDASGKAMYSSPALRFYPETQVFCVLSSEGSSASSFFGGDICDIRVTEDYIQTPKGTLYRKE